MIDLAYTFTHNFAKHSSQESVDHSFSLRKIVLSRYAHDMMFTQCLENDLYSLMRAKRDVHRLSGYLIEEAVWGALLHTKSFSVPPPPPRLPIVCL